MFFKLLKGLCALVIPLQTFLFSKQSKYGFAPFGEQEVNRDKATIFLVNS